MFVNIVDIYYLLKFVIETVIFLVKYTRNIDIQRMYLFSQVKKQNYLTNHSTYLPQTQHEDKITVGGKKYS